MLFASFSLFLLSLALFLSPPDPLCLTRRFSFLFLNFLDSFCVLLARVLCGGACIGVFGAGLGSARHAGAVSACVLSRRIVFWFFF